MTTLYRQRKQQRWRNVSFDSLDINTTLPQDIDLRISVVDDNTPPKVLLDED